MAATLRYSVVAAGAVGFLGGVLCRDRNLLPKFELDRNLLPQFGLDAATPIVPLDPPMEVDEPGGGTVARTMKFGFPGLDTIRSRKSYVLSYDRRNRVPHWVLEHLTADNIAHNDQISRSKSEFFEDSSVHPYFRSTNRDYRGSGFDRGHLAAAGNHRATQDDLDDTFVLSNVAPQVGKGFNRDAWNRLEKQVRKRVRQCRSVWVCTGPLYLPRFGEDGVKYVQYRVVGPRDVAVPTHFFKVLVGEREDGKLEMDAYVMPNAPIEDNVPLSAFMVPRDVVERAAGLLLFDKLPDGAFHRINGRTAAERKDGKKKKQ